MDRVTFNKKWHDKERRARVVDGIIAHMFWFVKEEFIADYAEKTTNRIKLLSTAQDNIFTAENAENAEKQISEQSNF